MGRTQQFIFSSLIYYHITQQCCWPSSPWKQGPHTARASETRQKQIPFKIIYLMIKILVAQQYPNSSNMLKASCYFIYSSACLLPSHEIVKLFVIVQPAIVMHSYKHYYTLSSAWNRSHFRRQCWLMNGKCHTLSWQKGHHSLKPFCITIYSLQWQWHHRHHTPCHIVYTSLPHSWSSNRRPLGGGNDEGQSSWKEQTIKKVKEKMARTSVCYSQSVPCASVVCPLFTQPHFPRRTASSFSNAQQRSRREGNHW